MQMRKSINYSFSLPLSHLQTFLDTQLWFLTNNKMCCMCKNELSHRQSLKKKIIKIKNFFFLQTFLHWKCMKNVILVLVLNICACMHFGRFIQKYVKGNFTRSAFELKFSIFMFRTFGYHYFFFFCSNNETRCDNFFNSSFCFMYIAYTQSARLYSQFLYNAFEFNYKIFCFT